MKYLLSTLILLFTFELGIILEKQLSINRMHKVSPTMEWGDCDYAIAWFIATGDEELEGAY